MDDPSKQLIDYLVGNSIINHLMYADDLVTLSPYNSWLQQLSEVYSQHGKDYHINFNTKKRVMSW